MVFSNVINDLNFTASDLSVSEKINFTIYENANQIASEIANVVPFSSVVILSTENSFLDYGISLYNQLKKSFLRPINICVQKQKRLSIDGVMGIFNVAEDVRFVIVTDSDISEVGLYFATVRNLPVLFITNGFDLNCITSNSLLIENGKNLNEFTVSTKRTIAINYKNLNHSSLADGIAVVGSKIVGLIDYKINAVLFGKEQNAKLIQQVETSIDSLLKLNSIDKEELMKTILFASYTAQLVRLADQEFYSCSSAVHTALLVENATCATAVGEFVSAKRILNCLVKAFSSLSRGEKISDYKAIAKRISDLTGRDFNGVCKDILYKLDHLRKCGGVERLWQLLKNTAVRAQTELNFMDKLFKEYGGKSNFNQLKASSCIGLSGYVGKSVNCITLVKEMGF